jgi:hypothetical protein
MAIFMDVCFSLFVSRIKPQWDCRQQAHQLKTAADLHV